MNQVMEQNSEDDIRELVLKEKLFKARHIQEKHIVTVLGKAFIIYPGVFNPDIFPAAHITTNLLIKLTERVKPKRILEIGAGAGYNGVLACSTGVVEHVTCTDISQNAVDNIQENIDKYQLNHCMTAVQSNVFDSINADVDKKFDLIYWHFPFAISKHPLVELDETDQTLFDPGYVLFEKYVRSVDQYLTPNSGRVFIAFSLQVGDYKMLCDKAMKYGRTVQPIMENDIITNNDLASIKLPGATFGIYELCKKSRTN